MAQRSRAGFKTTKNSRYATNGTGAITGANSRDMFEDVADSFLNRTDDVLDEDDMASNSDTAVPTQQSVKAFVESQVGGSNSVDTYSRIFEDFDVGPTGYYNLSTFNNGGGLGGTVQIASFGQDNTDKAIGVTEFNTAASTAGGSGLVNTIYRHPVGFGAIHSMIFRAALSALSDGTNTYNVRLGYMDSYQTSVVANGIYFRYTHASNGGKWEAVCTSAGTTTQADTGVTAIVGSFSVFKIVVNSDATQVDFYIDGVLTNSITTNIPTASGTTVGQAAVIEKVAGSTSRSLYLDYVEKTITRTTAR